MYAFQLGNGRLVRSPPRIAEQIDEAALEARLVRQPEHCHQHEAALERSLKAIYDEWSEIGASRVSE